MLDSLRLWPHILARLGAGPFGPYLTPYVEKLHAQGYAPTVVRLHVHGIDVFGQWISRRGLRAEVIDEFTIDRFSRRFPRRRSASRPRGRRTDLLGGIARFVAFLRECGAVPDGDPPRPTTATDRLLEEFDAHLVSVRGLSCGTRRTYLRYARAFCDATFAGTEADWSRVDPQDVTCFVVAECERLAPSARRVPVTATRALLRYLALEGAVADGLRSAVPIVREWKHASLPTHLSSDEMARVMESSTGDTPVRVRDRAILLLLARLGLRASEVAHLRLDDFDWRGGRLQVRSGKSDCPRVLPLLADVGEAIVRYLRGARPVGRGEAVLFWRCLPPPGPLSAVAVGCVARRALRRAQVRTPRPGSHVFRHGVATQMVRSGASFKEVADVLGHARLETAGIYAKLDLDALGRVALPWTGGAR